MDRLKGQGFIYLGGPYSHADEEVRIYRFEQLTRAAAYLLNQGFVVHSPITQGHTIASRHDLPRGWDPFWRRQSLGMLAQAAGLVILPLPGWENSEGLTEERALAGANGQPIHFLDIADLG